MNTNKDLSRRLKVILKWCEGRGINQIYAFFKGCDVGIAAQEARIRYVLRNTHLNEIVDEDAAWIASMEATIAAVNARKPVAA